MAKKGGRGFERRSLTLTFASIQSFSAAALNSQKETGREGEGKKREKQPFAIIAAAAIAHPPGFVKCTSNVNCLAIHRRALVVKRSGRRLGAFCTSRSTAP